MFARPALLLLAVAGSTAFATTYPSKGAEDLASLAERNGTWVTEGKWSNGNPFKARQRFEPLLGGKFVACRTWSASGDAAESERDYVIFGLTSEGKLVQWVYTPNGQCRQTVATPTEDRTIQFDWTQTDAKGKSTEMRQVLTPSDADRYGWRVMMHIKGEWHTLLQGEWKRG